MARLTMSRLPRRGSSELDVEVKQVNDSTIDITAAFNIDILLDCGIFSHFLF